jgi:hypothetical protein
MRELGGYPAVERHSIARDEAEDGKLDERRRTRWKLPLVIVAVVVLAAAGLLAFGRFYGLPNGNQAGPPVPTQISGEHVYRAIDRSSFTSLKGSFLLGGLVTYPDVVPPCPSEAGPPGDGQALLPYCYWPSIDGLALSPKGSFDEPGNEVVVARVHVNDPLAAECQPAVRAECDAAIVVESVVWRSKTS